MEKLNVIATNMNNIMTHTLMFLKLYLLNRYDEEGEVPTINSSFVVAVMKTICKREARGGRKPKEDNAVSYTHLTLPTILLV